MNSNFLLAKYNHGGLLVLSSCFFIIPSVHAYYKKLYYLSILLFFTSVISVNYWRNAIDSWRRDLDLVFSKISFFVVFCNGVYHVTFIPYLITGYSGMFFMLYFYYLSCKHFEENNIVWYKYHFLFHILVASVQLIVVDSIL
jgi:hypothetical protein